MAAHDTEFFNWLVDVRRDLHMHPEIAYEENRTSSKITDILKSLGIRTMRFDDMTGVVGLIEGPASGPTIALRADIDALPIQELNDCPYKSRIDGRMHACGHEASTTIVLGVAKKLIESGLAASLNGNVKFLFQPAEEIGAGAKAMIARGVLENPKVDRIIAGHMSPDIPVGQVGHFRNLGYASADRFSVKIIGRGSHGARPEDALDPVVAGAHFITQIQSIVARNIKPTEPAVVTVGRLVSGDVGNVIPESAFMEGTIRALSEEVRQQIFARLHQIAAGLDHGFQVQSNLTIKKGPPCLYNDPEVAAFLHQASESTIKPENVRYLPPIMASEDFAYFTAACPGAIMRFGCGNADRRPFYPLHSPHFDIDERVLKIGVGIFTDAIRRYLRP